MIKHKKRFVMGLLSSILVIGAFLLFVTATSTSAKNDNAKGGNSKDEKSNKEKKVVEKKAEVKKKIKDYEKATDKGSKKPPKPVKQTTPTNNKKDTTSVSTSGIKTNAGLYKKNMDQAVDGIEEIVVEEEVVGNDEVVEELEEIVDLEEEEIIEVTEIIEEVEGQNKFKVALFGTDYKNLGKLRSSLAHNENQIRKVTKTMEKVQSEESNLELQEQLVVLTQERERVKDVISENESQFSMLGWVRRLFSGYVEEPLDTVEEDELLDEVVEVLDEEVLDDGIVEDEIIEEVVEEEPTQLVE